MTDTFRANGAKFIAADDMIVRALRRNEAPSFEPETFEWMWRALDDRDGVFVDVGAATGWFSIPVAKAGRDALAFEANARVYDRLIENIHLNGVGDAVSPRLIAVSDTWGDVVFRHNPLLPLTSGGSLEPGWGPNTAREKVKAAPLDGLVRGPVAMIKIDVERHEMPVLGGAARIIAESRPALILEANDDEHRDVLSKWLSDHGYTWTPADERNMLCLPE